MLVEVRTADCVFLSLALSAVLPLKLLLPLWEDGIWLRLVLENFESDVFEEEGIGGDEAPSSFVLTTPVNVTDPSPEMKKLG